MGCRVRFIDQRHEALMSQGAEGISDRGGERFSRVTMPPAGRRHGDRRLDFTRERRNNRVRYVPEAD
jgi:hypothetical protein